MILHKTAQRLGVMFLLALAMFPIYGHCSEDALVMGIFPRRNTSLTMKLFTPMAHHLSSVLGREVKLATTKDYPSFWKAVTQKRYDIVHYNQLHYLESHEKYGYQVILMNVEFERDTLAGALVIREDSGIQSLKELKGKKIIFGGGKKAMIAYVATTALLRRAGLNAGDYQEIFAKNPPAACIAVYQGLAVAGGVGDIVLNLPSVRKKIKTDEMYYLAGSDQMAHLPWAVKDDLNDEIKEKITKTMMDLKNTEEGRNILKKARITALIKAKHNDYNVLTKIIAELK